MDAEEEKKPRIVKPDAKKAHRKRLIVYTVGGLLLIALIAVLTRTVFNVVKPSPSKQLIATTSRLRNGKYTCQQALKQFKPTAASLSNSSKYTLQAREAGLDYLT